MTTPGSLSEPQETETKFRVDDRSLLEARLAALGATRSATEDETNVLFDDDTGRLKERGRALRLRRVAGRALVTFKGKATTEKGVKSRVERETGVESAETMQAIFRELGLTPRFTYQKRRTTFTFPGHERPVVVVDETPIGLFAEIEGEDAAVRSLARELRVPESAFLDESYVSLYLAARRDDPSLPEDMLFADFGKR